MSETVLIGKGRQIHQMDRRQFERHLDHAPQEVSRRLAFMSEAHHRVRYFVVRELARLGRPVAPPLIAQAVDLPLSQVVQIMGDLEKHLFFLFRNEAGDAAWAYPVTAVKTAHQIRFKSGETLYAA